MRVVLPAAVLCAATIALAACGSGGSRSDAAPAWVQKANVVCKREDPKIKAANYMTADFADRWFAELDALASAELPQHIPSLMPASQKAYHLLRYTDYQRGADRWLLTMKRDALAQGVRCSFGARPTDQLPPAPPVDQF